MAEHSTSTDRHGNAPDDYLSLFSGLHASVLVDYPPVLLPFQEWISQHHSQVMVLLLSNLPDPYYGLQNPTYVLYELAPANNDLIANWSVPCLFYPVTSSSMKFLVHITHTTASWPLYLLLPPLDMSFPQTFTQV